MEQASEQPVKRVYSSFEKLISQACQEYDAWVVEEHASYAVFVKMFLSGVDASSVTTYDREAVMVIRLLLEERQKLFVEIAKLEKLNRTVATKVFYAVTLEMDSDEIVMFDALVEPDDDLLVVLDDVENSGRKDTNPLKCTLQGGDWKLVAECMNRCEMFTRELSASDAEDLFYCRLSEPLFVLNKDAMCFLFDSLYGSRYIHYWQTNLCRTKMIYRPEEQFPMTPNSIRTILSRARQKTDFCGKAEIVMLLNVLNEIRRQTFNRETRNS
jgi:hypothetical protein